MEVDVSDPESGSAANSEEEKTRGAAGIAQIIVDINVDVIIGTVCLWHPPDTALWI